MSESASVREIDISTWYRRQGFEWFQRADKPMWGITIRLKVSALRNLCKQRGWSYFMASYFLVTYAANEYEPIRYRIRGDKVIVHDRVHSSSTILRKDETYGFLFMDMRREEDFAEFMARTKVQLANFHRDEEGMKDMTHRDDVMHGTVLPLVDFTGFEHAMGDWVNTSIPKFVFGKLVKDSNGDWSQSFALHVHHGLMDGLHVGRFLSLMQKHFDDCARILGAD